MLILLLLLGIGFLAVTAVFAPWAFYLGGKFHWYPYWSGWGRLHSNISGDYVIYVSFEPSPGGTGSLSTFVSGVGYVCTPRGDRIRMTLVGTMRKHLNLSTDGEAMYIKIYHRPYFSSSPERRPRVELRGHWRNPDLVMNDDGSISRSFEPDGGVYLGNGANRPYKSEVVPITLKQGSYSEFKDACASPSHNGFRHS